MSDLLNKQRETDCDKTPSAFASFVAFTQMRLHSISVYFTKNGERQEYIAAVLSDKMILYITCCSKVAGLAFILLQQGRKGTIAAPLPSGPEAK